VTVGTQQVYKVGQWTPVAVEVEISAPMTVSLALETIDSDGNPNQISFEAVKLDAPGKHQISGQYLPGRLEADLTVNLLAGEEVLATKKLSSTEGAGGSLSVARKLSLQLVGIITSEATRLDAGPQPDEESKPVSFWYDSFKTELEYEETLELLTFKSFSELPQQSRTLEMFDSLIFTDHFDVTEAQSKLLENWVKNGGKLAVVLAGNEEQFQNSPLASWIPVDVKGTVTVREMGALENYVGKGKIPGRSFKTTKMTPRASMVRVDVTNLEGPVMMSAPCGFGQLKILGVDLTAGLFVEWEGLSPLLYKVIGIDLFLENEELSESRGNLARGGISDTRTQMQTTLDQFNNQSSLSIWGIMIRIMGLLLIIGPVDYLLVHYILKSPALTWLTFPIMLVLAVSWAVKSTAASRMEQPALRTVNVLDVDQETGYCHTQTWQSFKAPESNSYDVKLTPDLQPLTQHPGSQVESLEPALLSWSGTPEDSFLGMYRTGGLSIMTPEYSFASSRDTLEGVPVAKWSSKVIESDWVVQTRGLIESDLKLGLGGQLVGHVVHHLPEPITDWFIAYDGRVYRQPIFPKSREEEPLKPHQRWNPSDSKVQRRILKQFLLDEIDPSSVNADALLRSKADQQSEYQIGNSNPLYYFKAITFRDFLGGRDLTKITNDVFKHYDLSEQMSLKRAILIGKTKLPVSKTSVNGVELEPEYTETVVRILLSVDHSQETGEVFLKPLTSR